MSNMINSLTGTQYGSIKPSQKQQTLDSNYLNFTNGDGNNFAQQYLPEIYEAEVERYGNRTLSGFLRMVGAEMPMSSDQIVWSEQNRLHIAYNGVKAATATTLTFDINSSTVSNGNTYVDNVISIGQTLVVMSPTTGKELKVLVTNSVNTSAVLATITVACYTQADLYTNSVFSVSDTNLKIFVYGSEHRKGTADDLIKSVTPTFTQDSQDLFILSEFRE